MIGASRRQDSIGQALVRNLVTGNFTGRVHVVNLQATAVSGLACRRTPAAGEIPDQVDVAVVAVPAESVQTSCSTKGGTG